MTRPWIRCTLLLSLIACAMLLSFLAAWRGQYSTFTPNPLDEYIQYQPGESFHDLIGIPGCQMMHESWYDSKIDIVSLFCEFPHDAHLRFILVYPDEQMHIQSSYYFFKSCAINAGNMLIWYQGNIITEWRGSRHIIWHGGDSWTWYNRRRAFWSPHLCVYYARFKA